MKEKAPTRKQRLNLNLGGSDDSTKPPNLTNSGNGRKTLKQIARIWVSRGYYSTPSEAMRVCWEVLVVNTDRWTTSSNIKSSLDKRCKMSVLRTYLSKDIGQVGLKRNFHKTPVSQSLFGGAK